MPPIKIQFDMSHTNKHPGVQENLVSAGAETGNWDCTPITDYWSYANRQWAVAEGMKCQYQTKIKSISELS